MEEALRKLSEYVHSQGNHKLEKTKDEKCFAIVRKSKDYGFGIDFEALTKMGFRATHCQTYNRKDEVIVEYIGPNKAIDSIMNEVKDTVFDEMNFNDESLEQLEEILRRHLG